MTSKLEANFAKLTSDQKEAVTWGDGAALVLAGPGVGKTFVLTARTARILDEKPNHKFRVLALTFTTKAGDEMRGRVEEMVPSLAGRANIGTFHSFCAQLLRQHGSHVGIRPSFALYDQEADRREILREALVKAGDRGEPVSSEDVRWLSVIDQLRSNLVSPRKTAKHFSNASEGERVAKVYDVYEQALRDANISDFNGLILNACRLAVDVPQVAQQVRDVYPYWMIDEFQDTTPAQYKLVKFLAGETFKNIFAVADDDQIIFQWAGASYHQIVKFRQDFSPALMQLVQNRRCPEEVVQAANNVIAHNSRRTPNKAKLIAAHAGDPGRIVELRFSTDIEEAEAVAHHFAQLSLAERSSSVVLARNRALFEPILAALKSQGLKFAVVARRDRFLSPQFVWLQCCLELALRPSDRRIFATMVAAANTMSADELDSNLLAAEAESSGAALLECWANKAALNTEDAKSNELSKFAKQLLLSRSSWAKMASDAVAWLSSGAETDESLPSDVSDDRSAWAGLNHAIRSELRRAPTLEEFVQGLALRPKEPELDVGTLRLMSIHSAKGLEFSNVWLAGAAEEVLPSWQSLKSNAKPEELEEERRNFFVAITRTKRHLYISSAERYRGRERRRSRFLDEMRGTQQ